MAHPNVNYTKGDATDPQGEGNKIIVHCCNDIGVWGAGFVIALSKKWPQVEQAYKEWHAWNESEAPGVEFNLVAPIDDKVPPEMDFALGAVQYVWVDGDPNPIENDAIWVANMIGQRSTSITHLETEDDREIEVPPIRYGAIMKGLHDVARFAEKVNASVHAPRFGAGLAGGDWEAIETIIGQTLFHNKVTIYDYEP